MAKKRHNDPVQFEHYRWKLYERNGVFYADGRSNSQNLGRHSLGVESRDDALQALKQLDVTMAVRHGRIPPTALSMISNSRLSIADGIARYQKHVSRSPAIGGAAKATTKRYGSILKKFQEYANKNGIATWQEVNSKTIVDYVGSLEALGRADSTIQLVVTTLKQTVNLLVKEKLLSSESKLDFPLRKPDGTTTYCWTTEEVAAMLDHCRQQPGLRWMEGIIVGLACTGLRISELVGLRWMDVHLERGMIQLVHERGRPGRIAPRHQRTTKSHRGRSFPIHVDLRAVLERSSRQGDGFVFHGPNDQAVTDNFVRSALIRHVLTPLASRFPAIEGERGFADGRPHSFRHYFCSVCSNSGVSENAVMRWLGHKDSQMVRHYYHLHDAEAQRQMGSVKFF